MYNEWVSIKELNEKSYYSQHGMNYSAIYLTNFADKVSILLLFLGDALMAI